MNKYKSFEEFIKELNDEKHKTIDHFLEILPDTNSFDRGYMKGQIDAYEEIINDARCKLKFGLFDDDDTIECG